MNRKQLTTRDKVLLGVLAALIVVVIGVGVFLIVSNTNAANEQTQKALSSTVSGSTNSSSSNSSSTATDSTEKAKSSNSKSSDTKSDSSNGGSTSSKIKNTTPGYNSSGTSSKSSKSSSKTSSKNKVKGDKVKRVVPKENKSHASDKTLKINDTTCYVGDTITIVLNLTSQKSIVNYQGVVKFDSNYLKVKEVKSNDFGVANANGSEILYNASAINGMNFSETGTVFTATFEVLKAGSTKVTDNMEIISELVNNNIKQLSQTDYTARLDIYK